MMSIGKSDPDEARHVAPVPREAALRDLLARDWRRLFPWRLHHGQAIRRLLHNVDRDAHVDARAAFGLIEPTYASSWLYRDFYVEVPPGEGSVDRAIGKLRRGNPAELQGWLHRASHTGSELRPIWYEVSTLTGRVVDPLGRSSEASEASEASQASEAMTPPAVIIDEPRAGHPRARRPSGPLPDAVEIVRQMRRALGEPIGVEPHRQSMLRTLGTFTSGALSAGMTDHSVALLIHHADIELRRPIRWSQLGMAEREVILREFSGLREALSSPPAFTRLLHRGLASPSRKRRLLSYRLLRLDGHLDHRVHYDDLASSVADLDLDL